MIKKELRKISLQFRTLSSQLLQIDSQEELGRLEAFYSFVKTTDIINEYINECHAETYDFKMIFEQKGWNNILVLPSEQKDIIDFGIQLIEYILDGPKQLINVSMGYSSNRKFSDNIQAFMRKSVEPLIVAIRTYLEMQLIDADDKELIIEDGKKKIFLSYCQKDKNIADLIDNALSEILRDKATVSRDIRDVEYHESFKKFMQSIEIHDYVLMIISDRYLKSRNCLFEVLEVVKDSGYSKKLAFVVLSDEDEKYIESLGVESKIGADVYSTSGMTNYIKYWKSVSDDLQQQIDDIANPMYAIEQIKEKKIVERILLDLPEFISYLKDVKGLALTEHIEHDFREICLFMGF